MEDLSDAQIERTELMIDPDNKRDKLVLKHKADEAQ